MNCATAGLNYSADEEAAPSPDHDGSSSAISELDTVPDMEDKDERGVSKNSQAATGANSEKAKAKVSLPKRIAQNLKKKSNNKNSNNKKNSAK